MSKIETLEEFLSRGGKIERPAPREKLPPPVTTILKKGLSNKRLPPHGTLSRYVGSKCRCEDCKAALREYSNHYYKTKRRRNVGR